ncbi:hypothetical protein CANCADRAFT_3478 [Tortispora caseinolytica NRRL Y-17796]|uniref:Uncharacterized protein n=1 Tax=Tortispora caseinolytica NRRL Y-17796 TaxID=767744 RepID=A0A1E4TAQ3_9ASCO|nr:hypothetical protein CANCADRAFT_3478 [Tortispora caseinolytica NRRL Y-17796]
MEEEKCWICLETHAEDVENKKWVRPCACSLTAHEQCLLDWLLESKNLTCPQCGSGIRIESASSVLGSKSIAVYDIMQTAYRTGLKALFIGSVAGASISSIYSTLFAIGAAQLRVMCPTDMAFKALGVSQVSDTEYKLLPLDGKRLTLIPMIPVCLVCSRMNNSAANGIISWVMFLASVSTPLNYNQLVSSLKPSEPIGTLWLVMEARLVYMYLYDKYILPKLSHWIAESFTYRRDLEMLLTNNANNVNQGGAIRNILAAFPNAFPRIDVELEVLDGINNAPEQPDQDPPVADNQQNRRNQEQHRIAQRRRARNIVVGVDTLFSMLSPLLLPSASSFAGNILGKLPFFKKMNVFSRNVIAGSILVVLNDLIYIGVTYLRAKDRKGLRIAAYKKK